MPKSPTRPTQCLSPQWARALHRWKPRHSCRGGCSPRRQRLPPDRVPQSSPRDGPAARRRPSRRCGPRADPPGSAGPDPPRSCHRCALSVWPNRRYQWHMAVRPLAGEGAALGAGAYCGCRPHPGGPGAEPPQCPRGPALSRSGARSGARSPAHNAARSEGRARRMSGAHRTGSHTRSDGRGDARSQAW